MARLVRATVNPDRRISFPIRVAQVLCPVMAAMAFAINGSRDRPAAFRSMISEEVQMSG
ncbi:MAG: hypothetical protein ACLTZY_05755 [Alistipes indistinctus]